MALCSYVPSIHIVAVILGSLEIILFGGVIFGWHSVVYIYKDTGYFSDLCPAEQQDPSLDNISFVPHVTTPATFTSYNFTYITNATTSPRTMSNWTSSPAYKTPDSNENASIPFDELTCEQQMKIHAVDMVSKVCKPQDEQFNLIFSLATGINGMMSFPSGFLYDRVGTRISRIISIVSFLVGELCLIFASSSNPYLLYPGFIGLVYGGYQILLTNLQLSCLIPSLRSTIMSLYAGSYDTSSSIFLLFKASYESGVSINASFTVQAILYFLIFASTTFFFLPSDRVPFPLTPGFRLRCYLCHKLCGHESTLKHKTYTSNEWRVDPTGSIILSRIGSIESLDAPIGDTEMSSGDKHNLNGCAPVNEEADFSGRDGDAVGDSVTPVKAEAEHSVTDDSAPESQGNTVSPQVAIESKTVNEEGPDREAPEGESMLEGEAEEEKTFIQVALSPLFLTDLLWISSQRLRSWIFVGMFNPWITRLACGDKALVSHYTSVYAGLQFFGILTAPLSGRLMDRKVKGGEKYGNYKYERLHASIASFVLNSTVSVLLTVCTLIPVLKLQYLTFVLHCLHRSFLYGPNSAFVANAFPNQHFGKLFGVTLTVSAMFSMIQYPLFLIMQGPLGGDPLAINVFLLVLMLISYIHPFYIWRYLQKKLAKASASA